MAWWLKDWRGRWGRAVEDESLRPDLGRAVRSTVGLMVPLALATAGWLPLETPFVVIAAHSMTLADVRGAYPVRFGFLVAMALVLAGITLLGTLAAGHAWTAVLATAAVALNSGLWRHLTPEYGPALATPAGLLFFIAVLVPAGDHALAVLAGATWGLLVQMATWPLRHEHPLRRAVADSWLAAGELFGAYAPAAGARQDAIVSRETALRGALDSGYETLAGAAHGSRGRRGRAERLERLHAACARLATDVAALNTALDPVVAAPSTAAVGQAWQAAAESLANTARAVAVATVSRQPAHLAVSDVRLRRASSLLQSLRVRAGEDPAVAGILSRVELQLTEVGQSLRDTIERAGERAIFPLELFDLNTWRLRPLAAVLNLSTRPDPAIVRFTLRSAAVTMLAVLACKLWPLPHAYWLPYTVVVVLQADYGATRLRAGQRLSGTLLGGILGSALLMLRLPHLAILAAVAATGLLFGYFMRRNYAVAVIFITLFVVLLTEASHPVTVALTLERLGSTTAGGFLAMAAAFVFWPSWERQKFPGLLAAAVRANRGYLALLVDQLEHQATADRDPRVAAKRTAERANRAAFGSLERLFADPASRREGAERMAVVANGNHRLTRALNVISVRLETETVGPGRTESVTYARFLMAALDDIVADVERWTPSSAPPAHVPLPATGGWLTDQLLRVGTEVAAMRSKVGDPFTENGGR